MGTLLGDIGGTSQFATSGILTFDGAGNISATSTSGGALMPVGTYNVNSDCTITVSLTDTFGNSRTATSLAGVVMGRGQEIDLTTASSLQSQATTGTSTTGTGTTGTGTTGTGTTGTGTTGTGTTGTGTTGTGTTGTGTGTSGAGTANQMATTVSVRLVRVLYRNGCSDANLMGLYGFVLNPVALSTDTTTGTGTTGTGTTGTGTGTGTTGTGTGTTGTGTTGTGTTGSGTSGTGTSTTTFEPATLIGSLSFDGAGRIVSPASSIPQASSSATASPFATTPQPMMFSALQYSGTYTVNPDCSGSMTITNAANSSNGTGSSTGTGSIGSGSTGTAGTGATGTTGTSNASQSMTVHFLLTPPTVASQAGTSALNQSAQLPDLTLSFSNANEAGWGYARPQ